jgi:heme-degrading monooxygenase HmoA/pimeloyl-ACP methyl ester carboxylesterase
MIAVIFEVIPHRDLKRAYFDAAAALRPHLEHLDGFISIERFESLAQPGKILSRSFWRDEEAVERWRNLEAHRLIQAEGRQTIFSDYRLRVAQVVRDYGLNDRTEAPTDSHQYHDKRITQGSPDGTETVVQRERIRLAEGGQPTLSLQVQRPIAKAPAGDVVYVHGATFGADLSVYYRLDGRSWADDMNDRGLSVWGFDFAGYGNSERYAPDTIHPAGRIEDAVLQPRRVVTAVRTRNGDQAITLVAHSWGASVAARYTGMYPEDVKVLVLFAPIVRREPQVQPVDLLKPSHQKPSHYPLTVWAQYRRFIEDVPRGHPQVFSEVHFNTWASAFLSSNAAAGAARTRSAVTPYGPVADIQTLWSGHALYDPARIVAPTLLVRGE